MDELHEMEVWLRRLAPPTDEVKRQRVLDMISENVKLRAAANRVLLTREQIRTLAAIEPRLVEGDSDDGRWEVEVDAEGKMRVRDIERDFHVVRDGSQPWG